mmetsp:Transcript_23990/g.62298  ORF Transcript_23990/g.62298 Transcript_23990/m.62298 type:complete len:216 (+) Transcript_23990:984-1631(+)
MLVLLLAAGQVTVLQAQLQLLTVPVLWPGVEAAQQAVLAENVAAPILAIELAALWGSLLHLVKPGVELPREGVAVLAVASGVHDGAAACAVTSKKAVLAALQVRVLWPLPQPMPFEAHVPVLLDLLVPVAGYILPRCVHGTLTPQRHSPALSQQRLAAHRLLAAIVQLRLAVLELLRAPGDSQQAVPGRQHSPARVARRQPPHHLDVRVAQHARQ